MAFNGLSSRAVIGMFFEALSQDTGGQVISALGGAPMQSDQASETYPWIGQVPQMREWKGGRQASGFLDQSITISNVHYEATIDIPARWARLDKTGQIQRRIAELAQRANAHWMKLLMEKLAAGESTACYDGQFFFDTDHSEGDSGTQDNDITTDISAVPGGESTDTPANPGPVQMRAAIMDAVTQMLAFKDDQGEYVNELARNFLVLVPTTLFVAGAQAIGQSHLGSGDTNYLAQGVLDGYSFEIATSPRLNAWTDRFPVFCTDGGQKPFILQEEQPLDLKAKAEGSEYEFDNDAWQFGVDTWRGLDFGDWKKACLVTMV